MPRERGATGEVRGMSAEEVRKLFDAVLEMLPYRWARADFRSCMAMAGRKLSIPLGKEDLTALEHAFFRSLAPPNYPGVAGEFLAPVHARKFVEHRAFRLTAVYSAPDLSQLVAVLDLAEAGGVELTPYLAERREVYRQALAGLGIPTLLHRDTDPG